MIRSFVSFALVFVALAGAARPADACSPPACSSARTAPAGISVPLQVPAVPYLKSTSMAGPVEQTFTLLGAGDAVVPTTATADTWWPGGSLLVPSAPLTAGTYQLSYGETCGAGGQVKNAIVVGEPRALPSQIGSVDVANRVVGELSVSTASGSCTTKIQAVSQDIVIEPTPAIVAYAGVMGFDVVVDGTVVRKVYYGQGVSKDGVIVVAKLHAACGARDGSDDNGLTLGEHAILVKIHIAGAISDPAAVAGTFDFSCAGGTKPGGGGGEDSGTPGSSSGNLGGGGLDAGGPPSAPPAATPTAGSTSSCAAAREGAPGSAAALALVAAASVLAAARRRRA